MKLTLLNRAKIYWKVITHIDDIEILDSFPELIPNWDVDMVDTFDLIYDTLDKHDRVFQRRIVIPTESWLDSELGDLVDYYTSYELKPKGYFRPIGSKLTGTGGSCIAFGQVVFLDTSTGGRIPAGRQLVESRWVELDAKMNEEFFTHNSVSIHLYNQLTLGPYR